MYDENHQKRIMERVVKNEEEEEDIDVEDDQAEPEEPKIPPPQKVSMEIQTDDSFMSDQKTGSSHLEALRRERSQRRRKMIFNMMTRLQRKNLPHVSIMVRISLELKMIEFFENFPSVLPTTTMMNGQVSTIKVIQLQVSIDTCSGMLSTRRPANHTKTTGTLTLTSN